MNIIERGKTTLLLESENLEKIYLINWIYILRIPVNELFWKIKGRKITLGSRKKRTYRRKAAVTFASTGTPSFFVDPNK